MRSRSRRRSFVSSRFLPERTTPLICSFLVSLSASLLFWSDCHAERAQFLLEPGFQIGGVLKQQRFDSSRLRFSADAGLLVWLDSGETHTSGVGATLQGSFADSDARFALRPRYTWSRDGHLGYTLSAGYIFYTSENADGEEKATVSNSGFVGGGGINLGELALGLDLSVVSVGPTLGHDGGTETSLFGCMSFTGASGRRATLFGLALFAALSIAYLAANS